MARTRSTKTGPATSTESATPSQITLSVKPGPPPRLLILPKHASSKARIVSLPNPRHGRPSRYLVCPESGVYEFIKVAAPRTTPRSWLIETHDQDNGAKEAGADVVMDADLYMATEIDPLFLVLPALADAKAPKGSRTKKRLFLTSDDHLDKLPEESSHLSEILGWRKTRALFENRMAVVCDSVEAGDESMLRLSEDKLLTAILDKAKQMSDGGLPPSMEDKFVNRALEAPTLMPSRNIDAGESSACRATAESQGTTPRTELADSQSTAASLVIASSSASQPSTTITSVPGEDEANVVVASAVEAPHAIVNLQRLRVAFDFICSNYVSPNLTEQLQLLLKDSARVDFSPLDDYLAKVAQLRAEAVATGAFSDFSRKRSRDEEEDEARADRKRKLEDEKKRKANESRGVRDLKKVNTSGMKKMSDFFKAK
ncbi:RNase h2 complex component domain-containing protein [Hirsutella rhossiliensis]|uniref:Ribonuclease H2 subunit B n=1 Tax=Hirsutella rhossiliensis TaxID=111463 RepID=A0A9P8MP40_9HYPO|nr:RNase h2 complex component domain-containing protein [Hirsutella rhossiliensis]KAH0958690.1 RNase h2 complex component domain-containing protein [Hirsutella rhossiliensis]